jgi:pimeloyl-ACP methyl ester carboxylesterase
MSNDTYPVILVHGWNSHPAIWYRLALRMKKAGFQCHIFNYSDKRGLPIEDIARLLLDYIREIRILSRWVRPVNIVAHSLGSLVVRYLLEVMDSEQKNLNVRQMIMIAAPNKGSILAELMYTKAYFPLISAELTGVFIPRDYDRFSDMYLQNARHTSNFMDNLRSAGLRPDIEYRNILTINSRKNPDFCPWFKGMTWEMTESGEYRLTHDGDGVVSLSESAYQGIHLDILHTSMDEEKSMQIELFGHMYQPKNPLVIDLVMQYLQN